ncbi:MAG: redoxin domain-containing protein [candidate division Zixibacteria bacterium]|nr:redoxin domain-containing protein [candidate division Zixibacteria bacterium]
MKTKILLLTITLLLVLSSSAISRDAYNFELKDLDGNTVKLSDFAGKVVLLDFWATWCKPCRAAIPFLRDLHEQYGDKDFVLIGVNCDQRKTEKQIKDFMRQYEIEYLNVLTNSKMMQKYGIYAMPTTVLISPEQKEVKRYVGIRAQTEIELERAINNLLNIGGTPVDLCMGFIKLIGESADPEIADNARRELYKALGEANKNFNINFSVPGGDEKLECAYEISGILSVDGSNGRLTIEVIDNETGLDIESASSFGNLNKMEEISGKVASQIAQAIISR